MPFHKSLGDMLSAKPGLAPVAGTGSAQNGAWIDRLTYLSALAVVAYQTSGGVTGGTVTAQFQDATDSSGTGAANFGAAASKSIGAGPNEANAFELSADLSGARRYIRVVVTSAPTGGTPASVVSAAVVLGNPTYIPAV